MTAQYDYYRQALEGERLPAAFVDLDALHANLEILRVRAGSLPVRLVTKSVRSVAVIRLLLAAGPFLKGLLCYSPAEAAWLASLGFDDLVVAYPSVEPTDLAAVAGQLTTGRHITLMVDHEDQLDRIATVAAAHGVVMPVAIDLDMSSDFPGIRFGVYRSPVDSAAPALALAAAIARRPALRLDGLMGYEGQIAGLMDEVPGQGPKNRLIKFLKRRSIAEVNERRRATVAALAAAGHRLRFVNGGGTGSFESTRADPSVTELAAGSGLYLPTLFDHYAAFRGRPAAGFALPVTRLPRAGMVTCSGGGYPASGPAGADRLPRPWLPEGGRLIANEGAGEVQTPVKLPPGASLGIGDPLFFRHAKAGELCERFNTLLLIADGRVVDRVATYRGDGKCFF
ncbi:amino acid aldolase [Aliidongia dinghuensis]|uniref:Amino acid aldolase n=1 Tax=Aliidongia dinghuensis TaxID=1867774 RepID=A0A8J3E6T7_9PROT|nr:amino acid deaminase/aldolase [Aliidongia dinghuensis]GGF47887.1 amino acid aldolase [Aliidongia dinghuensis]